MPDITSCRYTERLLTWFQWDDVMATILKPHIWYGWIQVESLNIARLKSKMATANTTSAPNGSWENYYDPGDMMMTYENPFSLLHVKLIFIFLYSIAFMLCFFGESFILFSYLLCHGVLKLWLFRSSEDSDMAHVIQQLEYVGFVGSCRNSPTRNEINTFAYW